MSDRQKPTKEEVEDVFFALRTFHSKGVWYGVASETIIKVLDYWNGIERDDVQESTPWHSNGETKGEWLDRQFEKYAFLERERNDTCTTPSFEELRRLIEEIEQKRKETTMNKNQQQMRTQIENLHEVIRGEWPSDEAEELIAACKAGAVPSYEELEQLVLKWSHDRGIIANGKAASQLFKTMSELGELADAFAKGDHEEVKDAVGDTIVCLINFCALSGINLVQCLAGAYDTIKDRKGYLNEHGIFIKDVPTDNCCGPWD